MESFSFSLLRERERETDFCGEFMKWIEGNLKERALEVYGSQPLLSSQLYNRIIHKLQIKNTLFTLKFAL